MSEFLSHCKDIKKYIAQEYRFINFYPTINTHIAI